LAVFSQVIDKKEYYILTLEQGWPQTKADRDVSTTQPAAHHPMNGRRQ
jgi:hypothetical protein